MGASRQKYNQSDLNDAAKMLRLATLDFAGMPMGQIAVELECSFDKISRWRAHKIYLDAAEELKRGFKQDMLRLPATADTREKINAFLNLGLQRCGEILADFKHVRHSDIISVTRLLAQMDGRFLGGGGGRSYDSP